MWNPNELLEETLKALAEKKPKDAWIQLNRAKIREAARVLADRIADMETAETDDETELDDDEKDAVVEELDDAVTQLEDDEVFAEAVESVRASGKIEVTRQAGKSYYKWVVRAGRPKTVPADHKRIMVRMTASEHDQVKAFLKKIRKQ